jgi:hypothetical protein
MKVFRIAFLGVVALSVAHITQAQQSVGSIPPGLEGLRQLASSKTEFTLDHSMLVFASKLDQDNEDLRRVIAGVSGVSVHSFHFPSRWLYDPAELSSVKEEYHAAGWKHLVNKQDRDGESGTTDVWIRFDHNAISDVAILIARASDVNLVSVAGSISPLDLSHLGGHFGIPKIEGGVLVPNTQDRR